MLKLAEWVPPYMCPPCTLSLPAGLFFLLCSYYWGKSGLCVPGGFSNGQMKGLQIQLHPGFVLGPVGPAAPTVSGETSRPLMSNFLSKVSFGCCMVSATC